MAPARDAADLYARMKALAAEMPNFTPGEQAPETLLWLGRAAALIEQLRDLGDFITFKVACQDLDGPLASDHIQQIRTIFYRTLAKAEAQAPVGAQGAFIAVDSAVDAFLGIQKVLETARTSILVIDPYMDAKVTEFARAAPDGIPVHLLTSDKNSRPDLAPAISRWPTQFPSRPLEARAVPARQLHDRVIVIDGRDAWLVSQSLKDLAGRSPATIQKLDPEAAALKVAFYEETWAQATPLA